MAERPIKNKNMSMHKVKRMPSVVVMIAFLFVLGMSFGAYFNAFKKVGVSTVLAEEDEREVEDEKDNENENDDEDKEEDKDEKDEVRTQKVEKEENEDEIDDEDENEADDVVEELNDLKKDIQKVESKIAVLETNGTDVSSFKTALAEIESLIKQAESNPAGSENILETADHKLERLGKMVKMTLGDEEEEDGENEAAEKIQELSKKITKITAQINAAEAAGIDVSSLKNFLADLNALLDDAKAKLAGGDLAGAEAVAEIADKKLETLNHAVELALGDEDEDEADDEDEAKEYKNAVAQFVHSLKTLADMDGGIGQQVRVVAQAQNDSQAKAEEAIQDVNDRNAVVKFLFGPNYGSLAEIKNEIAANQNRIKVLTEAMSQITDPAVKVVLQEQIDMFQKENIKLQTFANENENTASVFGWLIRLFS